MKNIILFLLILFSSCSSRKVVIENVKKDSISETVVKTATVEDVKIETKNDILIDEFTITPLDTCKDIVINGISYKNVVLKYKKTKDNTIQVQDKKTSKIEDKQQKTKVEVEQKKKQIEKTPIPQLWLLWLLIPLIIYIMYKVYGRQI
jgi:hypothetical protein